MDTVRIRPFADHDFDALVGLYPPEWRFAGSTPQIDEAQARMDLACLVSCCNLRLVAEPADADGDGPHVAGLLLARTTSLPALPAGDVTRWEAAARAGRDELERLGGPCVARITAYVEQLGERAALLEEAAGTERGADNELELFVVGPRARGCGAGGALVGAFEETLRAAGETSYWLQTDTRCTWQWYERHGYVRVADVALTPDHPMPDAPLAETGAGAGTPAGEAPHVFMYRKDLA